MTPLTQALTQAAEEYTSMDVWRVERPAFLAGGHTGMKLAPKELTPYLVHKGTCQINFAVGNACTCGLEKLLKEVGE